VSPTAVARLRCPIGLAVGGNQPGEIAVSVVAELLQLRDAVSPRPDMEHSQEKHDDGA